MTVDLIGRKSNRSALGAQVKVTAGDLVQVDGAAGRRQLSLAERHAAAFRAGEAHRVDRIDVRWPGGGTQSVVSLPANQLVTITEGEGAGAVSVETWRPAQK